MQVKTNYAASQIGFRGDADLLLCLKIDLNGDWTELYYGDFKLVKQVARYSARDNKSMVAVTVLTRIRRAGYKLPDGLLIAPTDVSIGAVEPL
ncbi:DUF6998 domain-containing protein [Bradyrhizobium sp. 2S1]|uniref:DUF6998 domain-containing protein n=1 Tax=Bradyrhizobium sp. 2S1 TaxID=1404429 RepID=UPI00140AE8A7|nr:hypothetical protein [Bradyrhizobium sp. 2S1]MCK7666443.1 hypothetical protein [Bradyrhizobium sp. 2S1]